MYRAQPLFVQVPPKNRRHEAADGQHLFRWQASSTWKASTKAWQAPTLIRHAAIIG